MIPPLDAVVYEFDPHVLWAVLALCIAIFILVLMSAIPPETGKDGGRKTRL